MSVASGSRLSFVSFPDFLVQLLGPNKSVNRKILLPCSFHQMTLIGPTCNSNRKILLLCSFHQTTSIGPICNSNRGLLAKENSVAQREIDKETKKEEGKDKTKKSKLQSGTISQTRSIIPPSRHPRVRWEDSNSTVTTMSYIL